jgi:excisionase family DNA binding protein
MGDMLTTEQAANQLGLTARLVVRFCNQGRLKAEKFGRVWMIMPADLAAFKRLERPHGRHRTSARKAGRKMK